MYIWGLGLRPKPQQNFDEGFAFETNAEPNTARQTRAVSVFPFGETDWGYAPNPIYMI